MERETFPRVSIHSAVLTFENLDIRNLRRGQKDREMNKPHQREYDLQKGDSMTRRHPVLCRVFRRNDKPRVAAQERNRKREKNKEEEEEEREEQEREEEEKEEEKEKKEKKEDEDDNDDRLSSPPWQETRPLYL